MRLRLVSLVFIIISLSLTIPKTTQATVHLSQALSDTTESGTRTRAVQRALAATAMRILPGGRATYLHSNALQSVTVETNAAGITKGRRAFSPGGASSQIKGVMGDYDFTGQERDESTDLLKFQYRYLDLASTRWVSPDPLFSIVQTTGTVKLQSSLGESSTGYAYVANNMVGFIDPYGLVKKEGPVNQARNNRLRVRSRKTGGGRKFKVGMFDGSATGKGVKAAVHNSLDNNSSGTVLIITGIHGDTAGGVGHTESRAEYNADNKQFKGEDLVTIKDIHLDRGGIHPTQLKLIDASKLSPGVLQKIMQTGQHNGNNFDTIIAGFCNSTITDNVAGNKGKAFSGGNLVRQGSPVDD